MAVGFSIQVEGFTPFKFALGVLIDRATDLSPVWPDIVADISGHNRQQIETQGRHGGTPYPPLSYDYAIWKLRNFPGQPILVLEEDMLTAVTNPIWDGDRSKLVVGFPDEKVEWHQKGSGSLPRRPPVVLTKDQARQYPKMLHEHLFRSGRFDRVTL